MTNLTHAKRAEDYLYLIDDRDPDGRVIVGTIASAQAHAALAMATAVRELTDMLHSDIKKNTETHSGPPPKVFIHFTSYDGTVLIDAMSITGCKPSQQAGFVEVATVGETYLVVGTIHDITADIFKAVGGMVTKAAAETNGIKALDPATIDFELIIAQARRPKPKPVSIFLRHDLYAEIEELDAKLDILDSRLAGTREAVKDQGVADVDPVGVLEIEREELMAARNPLVTEFNASEVKFEFRLIERGDRIKAKAAMLADGHQPELDEENEIFPCYLMALTCNSVNWPGAQWLKFRDAVGEFPFLPLYSAFQDSGTAGMGITGPFSLRPLPTRATATS